MARSTPGTGIPVPESPDPRTITADLWASFSKVGQLITQTSGESSAALTAATAAEIAAGQAVSRVNLFEDPIHVGPNPPTEGEDLWVDTDEDPPPTPVSVASEDITDATDVGRNVLTAPLTADGRRALNIWDGTRAHLDEGTDTAERTWEAKTLAEFVASKAGAASWDDLTDKPTAFPPEAHNHDDRYYTESEIDQKIAAAVAGLSFNTGWQTITPDGGVTGTIKVKRQGGGGGDRTTIRLEGVLPPAGVGSAYLATLPVGFRHTIEHWFLADGRAGEVPSVIGLYNGSRVAWVQTVASGTTRPSDPITGEYTWESPDARPTI